MSDTADSAPAEAPEATKAAPKPKPKPPKPEDKPFPEFIDTLFIPAVSHSSARTVSRPNALNESKANDLWWVEPVRW